MRLRASKDEVAWVLRVHSVGEDAARRSKEAFDKGEKATGWSITLGEAQAVLDRFTVYLNDTVDVPAKADRSPKGRDAKQGSVGDESGGPEGICPDAV